MPVILLLTLFSSIASSSVGEFFGASAKSQALAGQSSYFDASANYYGAATLAFTEDFTYSLSFTRIDMNFKPIKNVLVASPVNSSQNKTYGSVDTDYPSQEILSFHASFPLFKFNDSKLGVSLFTPAQKLAEVNSGDPYRPEYSLYRSRFLRSVLFINYIQPVSETVSISVGAMSSIKSEGEVLIVANEAGSDNPSSGKLAFNAAPVFSLLVSLAKHWNPQSTSYFSFQDKAQSTLETKTMGLTPLGGDSSLKYNWDMSSMLYFDPAIYRLSHQALFSELILTASLEYQDWKGYKSPRLDLQNQGGALTSSADAQNFKLKNIIVSRIAIEKEEGSFSWLAGLSYRESPMKLKNHLAGNQLDLDSYTVSVGAAKAMEIEGQKFRFQLGAQHLQLIEKTIKKSGDKIGSPSYKGGGNVAVVSAGIIWSL